MVASEIPAQFRQTHVPIPDTLVRFRRALLAALDCAVWAIGVTISALVLSPAASVSYVAAIAGGAAAMQLMFGMGRDLYLGRHRIGSRDEQTLLLSSWLLAFLALEVALIVTRPGAAAALLLGAPIAAVLMLSIRQSWWMVSEHYVRRHATDQRHRVLVFGAGDTGAEMVRAMLTDPASPYLPVGIIDDDPYKSKRRLTGVAVVGNRLAIEAAARHLDAELLVIAVRTADAELIGAIDELGRLAGLDIRVVPSTAEMMGRLTVKDIRQLTEADLLGRAEVTVDMASILSYVKGRRVLVTGAGGSIGSELARQLHQLQPADLIMLDRDETALHSVQLSIEGKALLDDPHLVVADIRDVDRVNEIFARWKPQVVFHAAALKHLTLLELHPSEGVKTNTLGTRHLLQAATEYGTIHFVNVSTDKAADPTSVLGATKLLAERETARYAAATGRKFVSVRFGNVLGSRARCCRRSDDRSSVAVPSPSLTRT
ncbi:MAG: polysaccharide biosynthesis protein [Acidimicrobiales bacterium]